LGKSQYFLSSFTLDGADGEAAQGKFIESIQSWAQQRSELLRAHELLRPSIQGEIRCGAIDEAIGFPAVERK
jgi:hypothetical protein